MYLCFGKLEEFRWSRRTNIITSIQL